MLASPELMGILSGFSAAVLFIVIHCLTTYIAYAHSAGIFGMALTFILPILAEIYWIVHLWRISGSFMNALTWLCILFVLLVGSTYAFSVASREAT